MVPSALRAIPSGHWLRVFVLAFVVVAEGTLAAETATTVGGIAHTLTDQAVLATLPPGLAQGAMKGAVSAKAAPPGFVWYIVRGSSKNTTPEPTSLSSSAFWIEAGGAKYTPKSAVAFQPEDTSVMRSVKMAPGAVQPWVAFFHVPADATGVRLFLTNFELSRRREATSVALVDARPTGGPRPFSNGAAPADPPAAASRVLASSGPSMSPAPAPAATTEVARRPVVGGVVRVHCMGASQNGFTSPDIADSVRDLTKLLASRKKTVTLVDTPAQAEVLVVVTGREVQGTGQQSYATTSSKTYGGGRRTTTTSREKTTNVLFATLQVGDFRQPLVGAGPFWAVAADAVADHVEKWLKVNAAQVIQPR